MAGQKNDCCTTHRPRGSAAPRPVGSFSRPGLAIPCWTTLRAVPARSAGARCRVTIGCRPGGSCGKGVAEALGTTWQNVFRSVKHAVSWSLAHRSLSGIESIGVDEVPWQTGHKSLTLVPVQSARGQIDSGSKRLLWIGEDRTVKTFLRFFRMLGQERSDNGNPVVEKQNRPAEYRHHY